MDGGFGGGMRGGGVGGCEIVSGVRYVNEERSFNFPLLEHEMQLEDISAAGAVVGECSLIDSAGHRPPAFTQLQIGA
uniref:Uncharacterized protein n=1 Tax=Knipowitschia caucasica TaxID=637954 RepID=A0AAV2LS60_KNICA